jgi:uncharacterized linocin/CFP29 family protein
VDYLNRNQAQLPDAVWRAIDEAAVKAARDRLTARRFLTLEGPFGVGLTAIEIGDDVYSHQPRPDSAGMIIGRAIPVPMLRKPFRLSIRRIAAHLENRQPLDLTPAEDAAEAVADCEEELIYRGQSEFGCSGLLTHGDRLRVEGGDWSAVDRALADVLAAVTRLDDAGYRGPYALALAPGLFNGLFRLYPGTDVLQLEHLRRLCTRGIYKAPIEGGVLVDDRAGRLILGKDLRAGYSADDGAHYELFLTESICLRIDAPNAICTITATHGGAGSRRDRRPAAG